MKKKSNLRRDLMRFNDINHCMCEYIREKHNQMKCSNKKIGGYTLTFHFEYIIILQFFFFQSFSITLNFNVNTKV